AEGFRKDLADLQSKLKSNTGERQQSHLRQSGLANIATALIDLRDRVLGATDGFVSAEDWTALRSEIDEAVKAINRLAEQTGNVGVVGFGSNATASLLRNDTAAAELVDAQSQSVEQERTKLAAHEHTHLDTF